MLGGIGRVTCMSIVPEAVGYLDRNLLMGCLLIRLRWGLLHCRWVNVCHGHRLLRTGLMHGNRDGAVFLEGRLRRERMSLRLRYIINSGRRSLRGLCCHDPIYDRHLVFRPTLRRQPHYWP